MQELRLGTIFHNDFNTFLSSLGSTSSFSTEISMPPIVHDANRSGSGCGNHDSNCTQNSLVNFEQNSRQDIYRSIDIRSQDARNSRYQIGFTRVNNVNFYRDSIDRAFHVPGEVLSIKDGKPGRIYLDASMLYQKKIGSLIYASSVTRPEISRAKSHLAEFITNPGPLHYEAADQCFYYLYKTKGLCIGYCTSSSQSDELLRCSADAAYGNTNERRSVQGFVFKLGNGPVHWNSKDPIIKTKLKHVDINQHWVRERVQLKESNVKWISTSNMVADGMTKVLGKQKHKNFVNMLGLTEMNAHIQDSEDL
ncbi:hypothetical protein EPUL_003525 [Erysiphe pulchra]|uniref:Reverse transcriptase Ty1/copia-type domain-containing protein n=1 Tax=Erysiphe pulchra TaxID=225359 RepID=A0A2S4PT01_9PEZI|nr:hypothetical protein EPUL_003525 [Erysiphe pulchra]